MRGETLRTWTRRELEEAAKIEPEDRLMMRCLISARMLKLLIDYASEKNGLTVELISARGDPEACEMRFFYGDVPPERAEE